MPDPVTGQFYPAQGGEIEYGGQLMMGDGASPESFEAVAEVRSVKFGALTSPTYPRTHLRSPDRHQEKMPAIRDSESTVVQLNWRPGHESQNNAGGGSGSFASGGLLAVCRSQDVKNWKYVRDDGSPPTEIPFTAFVSRYEIGEFNNDTGTPLTVELTPINGAWHADLP